MLDAYRMKDVQSAKQVLQLCKNKGLSVDDCMKSLDSWITAKSGGIDEGIVREVHPCPNVECGGTPMRVTRVLDRTPKHLMTEAEKQNIGMKIVTCPKCRYSEVL